MTDRVFAGTNILVYAHDADADQKHAVAAEMVSTLRETRKGLLGTQILQECMVAVTRKGPSPISVAEPRRAVRKEKSDQNGHNFCPWIS